MQVVIFHNNQQKTETSLDPPAGFMTLGNEVFSPRFPMCEFLMALTVRVPLRLHAVTCFLQITTGTADHVCS